MLYEVITGRLTYLYALFYNSLETRQEWLDLALHGADFIDKYGFDIDGRAFYDRTRVGQLMSRAIGDVDEIRFFAGIVLGDILNLFVLLTGIYAIMFSIHAGLAALFLLPIPVLVITSYSIHYTKLYDSLG